MPKMSGNFRPAQVFYLRGPRSGGSEQEVAMNGIVYLVGLVVIVMAILSFLGLR
jgi:hypothetical protein